MYFEHPYTSNSDLGWLKNQLNPKDKGDPTNAYFMGNVLDAMTTEPERINVYKKTFDGKRVDNVAFNKLLGMRDAFFKDPFCRSFIEGASFQEEMYKPMTFNFEGYEFDAGVKCKWDIFKKLMGFGGDIKSTAADTQSQFEAAFDYFDYPRSRAFYMDIAGAEYDVTIGISKGKIPKIFKIVIDKKHPIYLKGRSEYLELLWRYNLMFTNNPNR